MNQTTDLLMKEGKFLIMRTEIRDIISNSPVGQTLTVCGWVRTRRDARDVTFVIISDGSCQETLQIVIPSQSTASRAVHECTTGASVKVQGIVRESPGKGQSIEIEAKELTVIGTSDPERYPLQKKGHTLEFLRELPHLRARTNTYGAVFRMRNILATAVHEFFQSRRFLWVHTPVITAADCEGAGALFTVTTLDPGDIPRDSRGNTDYGQDFFGRHAYLTVSGQLEAEFLALSCGKVYTFGPTFRAENSNTSRHLSEFWMVEPEMAFADLDEDIHLAEECIRFLCRMAAERGRSELSFLTRHYGKTSEDELRKLSEMPFPRITYTEAIRELQASGIAFAFPVQWGADLQSEHERYLTENIFRGPLIVTDFPKEIKAFYMRLNPDEKTVAAMDVLLPGIGEIVGGSQREERLSILETRMRDAGVPGDGLAWYLDLRRFGTAPHAGFGLGFDRFVQYVTGMPNIRDVIPCPRAPKEVMG